MAKMINQHARKVAQVVIAADEDAQRVAAPHANWKLNWKVQENTMLQTLASENIVKSKKAVTPAWRHRGAEVTFGDFGLKAVGRGRITARQIESARRAMTCHIKRGGRIWIRI